MWHCVFFCKKYATCDRKSTFSSIFAFSARPTEHIFAKSSKSTQIISIILIVEDACSRWQQTEIDSVLQFNKNAKPDGQILLSKKIKQTLQINTTNELHLCLYSKALMPGGKGAVTTSWEAL